MAVQLRPRRHLRPRARRATPPRLAYDFTGVPPAAPGPSLLGERPPWRVERVLFELHEETALRRTVDLCRAEIKSLHQLAAGFRRERDAARRTLAILAQQALDAEWEPAAVQP